MTALPARICVVLLLMTMAKTEISVAPYDEFTAIGPSLSGLGTFGEFLSLVNGAQALMFQDANAWKKTEIVFYKPYKVGGGTINSLICR